MSLLFDLIDFFFFLKEVSQKLHLDFFDGKFIQNLLPLLFIINKPTKLNLRILK